VGKNQQRTALLWDDWWDLRPHEADLRQQFAEYLDACSVAIVVLDRTEGEDEQNWKRATAVLELRFNIAVGQLPLATFAWAATCPADLVLAWCAVRNLPPRVARDEVAKALCGRTTRGDSSGAGRNAGPGGLFLARTGVVACHSFAHGEGHFYRYRVAKFKLGCLPEPLSTFLLALRESCPDSYFKTGPRVSHCQSQVAVTASTEQDSSLVRLTRDALVSRGLKSAHEDVEKYLVERDPGTVACEVPVWLEPGETTVCGRFSQQVDGCLTGHIDVLRIEEDGTIGVWDYKPNARKERMAYVQVFLYALMLSQRTGLAPAKFSCGYFDSEVAFRYAAGSAWNWMNSER
jgi:hypothetical protein